jgi:hypothetical protein
LTKGIEAKVESTGKIGLSFYGIPLHPEVVLQPLEFWKPVSLNISESVPIAEIDLGSRVKITGKVTIKVKFGVGPGPGLAAAFGTTGAVAAGSIGGTILLVCATSRLVGYAEEKGIAWAGKVAFRTGYAWRIAGEASGSTSDYNYAVEQMERHKSYGNYPQAYQGWKMASESIGKLGTRKQEFFNALKEKTGKTDVTSLHDAIFMRIGGIQKGEIMPPDHLFNLLR